MCDIDVCVSNSEEFDKDPDDAIDILDAFLEADVNVEGTEQSNSSIQGEKFVSNIQRKDHRSDSLIHNGDTDSSDDEDNRNCFDEKYSDFGKNIKNSLTEKECLLQENLCLRERASVAKEAVWKSAGNSVGTKPSITQRIDVYTDPVFGIRIVKPLVSSTQLKERMVGRTAIPMVRVKYHIQHGDTSLDWVIGGVIITKSPIRTSQKGSQYCIWRLSDLREGLKTVSVFLFRNCHKNLWKTAVGTVIGILNPGVLEDRNDNKDEATLSVDNAQKIMILGMSKDFGTCKSRKKNGDNCTAFVNVNKCEYCVFHVQQEYKKCSRRSELQSPSLIGLRNKVLGKNEVFYGGQSFTSIPAKVNRKQVTKDNEVLNRLSESYKPLPRTQTLLTTFCKTSPSLLQTRKPAVSQFDTTRKQTQKDQARLCSLLGEDKTNQQLNILQNEQKSPILRLQIGKAAIVDLSAPINTFHIDRAKRNAVQWVKRNGPFHREDPNNIKAVRTDGQKRAHENDADVTSNAVKLPKMNLKLCEEADSIKSLSRFQQLMETKSRHTELLETRDEQSQEEYFNTLEKKEKMEEKMLNTYKVACKAVRCLKCKYTSFSASDMCKTLGHPLKVMDAFKRFFRCRDCGNRTVSLDLIPLLTCKQCRGSQWQRAPMMRERKGSNLHVNVLSIRGGEEKFIGSTHCEGNLNLMVPE